MSSIEFTLNGKLINWDAWLLNKKITPRQAALLAYCLDPIVWEPKMQTNLEILSGKVRHLEMVLASEKKEWAIVTLIPVLDRLSASNSRICDGVPLKMRAAINAVSPTKLTMYEKRKIEAEAYIHDNNLILETLSAENLHSLLKQHNQKLWTIESGSFVKHFWSKFAKEKEIKTVVGRPPRQKKVESIVQPPRGLKSSKLDKLRQ